MREIKTKSGLQGEQRTVGPLWLLVITCLVGVTSAAQSGPLSSPELVRQAVANELDSAFVRQNCSYQYHREISGKRETRLMIKGSDLVVGNLFESTMRQSPEIARKRKTNVFGTSRKPARSKEEEQRIEQRE